MRVGSPQLRRGKEKGLPGSLASTFPAASSAAPTAPSQGGRCPCPHFTDRSRASRCRRPRPMSQHSLRELHEALLIPEEAGARGHWHSAPPTKDTSNLQWACGKGLAVPQEFSVWPDDGRLSSQALSPCQSLLQAMGSIPNTDGSPHSLGAKCAPLGPPVTFMLVARTPKLGEVKPLAQSDGAALGCHWGWNPEESASRGQAPARERTGC